MQKGNKIRHSLKNIWNRKLYQWWRHYNDEFLDGSMRFPLIRIGQSHRELGHWNSVSRTLTLSEAHISGDPWLSVMETLRHEMAHQYVDEILMVQDEPPHGQAFREACQQLRCAPTCSKSSVWNSSTSGWDSQNKILRRLKKVLSLANSPNEFEAQVAVQKARHLLFKYSIDLVELDEERHFSTRCLGEVKGRRSSHEFWLGMILNEYFFVEVLWAESYNPALDKTGSILQIFGTPANLDMAEYVFHFLIDLLQRLWQDYKLAQSITFNRERQRYFAGIVEGFYYKLQEQDKTIRETEGLVWQGDPKLSAFYRHLNPHVQTRAWGAAARTQAYFDGLREGRRLTIHKPVDRSSNSLQRYLTD